MKINTIAMLILVSTLFQCKDNKKILFAGGFSGGTYDTMAKSLQDIPSLKVKVINSNGSFDNINLLLDKKADFCLTQVDMYYSAKVGNSIIAKQTSILLPVLQDEIHLIVNSSIKTVNDFKGKKIAIGHSESGIKATSISVLRLMGVDFSEIETIEVSPNESIPKLLKNEIDAVFVVSGLPVKILSELPESSNIKIFNFENSILEKIKADNKVYQRSTIPANTYSWQKEKVNTLQVQTVLLARKDLTPSEISNFLEGLFSNLKELTVAHPEWNGLEKSILQEKNKIMPEFFNSIVKEKIK